MLDIICRFLKCIRAQEFANKDSMPFEKIRDLGTSGFRSWKGFENCASSDTEDTYNANNMADTVLSALHM